VRYHQHTALVQGNNLCFAILDAVESIYCKQSDFIFKKSTLHCKIGIGARTEISLHKARSYASPPLETRSARSGRSAQTTGSHSRRRSVEFYMLGVMIIMIISILATKLLQLREVLSDTSTISSGLDPGRNRLISGR
jgi:hypothetical protein